MTAEYLPGIIALLILIVVCMVIVIVARKLEPKLRKEKTETIASNEFTVGRIYQMEDGSFAKYIGDGKFKKVKEMD